MKVSACSFLPGFCADFDSITKLFDGPYVPLMPIQPLVRVHPERLANEGEGATIALNGGVHNFSLKHFSLGPISKGPRSNHKSTKAGKHEKEENAAT